MKHHWSRGPPNQYKEDGENGIEHVIKKDIRKIIDVKKLDTDKIKIMAQFIKLF